MEAWRHGGLEAWRLGGLEAWRHGSLEAWVHGGLEAFEGLTEGLDERLGDICAKAYVLITFRKVVRVLGRKTWRDLCETHMFL